MTYIPSSENLQSKVEHHEQRHLALRTVKNCFSRLELQRSFSHKFQSQVSRKWDTRNQRSCKSQSRDTPETSTAAID
jgi:hypothetical protein